MKEAVAVVWVHCTTLSSLLFLLPELLQPFCLTCPLLLLLLQAVAAVDCSVLPIVHVHCCREKVMDWVLHS